MTKPKLLGLTHKDAFHTLRQDVLDHVGLFIFAFGPQSHFELLVVVKMVLNGALVATRDKDQRINASRNGFLSRILDQRLVDDWQQLFGHGFGGW